jgi:hypothetical protein
LMAPSTGSNPRRSRTAARIGNVTSSMVGTGRRRWSRPSPRPYGRRLPRRLPAPLCQLLQVVINRHPVRGGKPLERCDLWHRVALLQPTNLPVGESLDA